jgi:dihydrofolate reductase
MRKVVIDIAISLDGFIADKKGSVSWLGGDGSDSANPGSYPDFIKEVDTILLGYTTYHQIVSELSPEAWPYEGQQAYVLTHRPLPNRPGITFVHDEVGSLLTRLKKENGKTIWICGGANLIQQAFRSKSVDELIVNVMPILLGEGIPLFSRKEESQKLRLISTKSYNGIVDLDYQILPKE